MNIPRFEDNLPVSNLSHFTMGVLGTKLRPSDLTVGNFTHFLVHFLLLELRRVCSVLAFSSSLFLSALLIFVLA